MTKIITRYFESAEAAHAAVQTLVQEHRVSSSIVLLFDEADGLTQTLTDRGVDPAAAQAYAGKVAGGGAVVLVRAGYKPLGVARIARETLGAMGAADMGGVTEETTQPDRLESVPSILDDHPRMLTRIQDPNSTTFYMANWPIPLIRRGKPFDGTLFPRHARMANWPIALLSQRQPNTASIFERHARMANFPIGLISHRKPNTASIFSRHARMANFPIGLISRRKPWSKTWIARHARMANWPFPHLINGKRGTNALMPGSPRMANFPIRLLSRRKPITASVFPRHARMANFPISLISHRKPFDKTMIPRHGRMADMGLPLVLPEQKGAGPLTLSGFFGIPTVIRRG